MNSISLLAGASKRNDSTLLLHSPLYPQREQPLTSWCPFPVSGPELALNWKRRCLVRKFYGCPLAWGWVWILDPALFYRPYDLQLRGMNSAKKHFPLRNTDTYSNRFSSLHACFLHQNPSGRGGVERWRGEEEHDKLDSSPEPHPALPTITVRLRYAEGQISAWKGILPVKPALTQLTCKASIKKSIHRIGQGLVSRVNPGDCGQGAVVLK